MVLRFIIRIIYLKQQFESYKALEDLDFYCMDNVPFELIGSATNYFLQNTNNYRNFAIGFDIRSQLSKEKKQFLYSLCPQNL